MAVILRKLWKNKPKQYGPYSFVQASLFHNAEKMGVDPQTISLAIPMWNSGDQYDYSQSTSKLTNNGAAFVNNRLKFIDTDSDYLILTNNIFSGLTEFSIFSQVETNNSVISTDQAIIGQFESIDRQVLLWFDAGNDKWQFIVAKSDTGGDFVIIQPGLITPSTNNEIVVGTFNAGNIKLYVNSENGGTASNASITFCQESTNNIYIGASNDSGAARFFDGYIQQLICFDKELTTLQVNNLSDNPWQLWQPRKLVFYSIPAVGGSYPINRIFNGPFSGPFAGAL